MGCTHPRGAQRCRRCLLCAAQALSNCQPPCLLGALAASLPGRIFQGQVPHRMWEGDCLHQVTGWCGGSNTRPLFSITRQLWRALFTGQEIPVGPAESAVDTPSQLALPHAQSCPPWALCCSGPSPPTQESQSLSPWEPTPRQTVTIISPIPPCWRGGKPGPQKVLELPRSWSRDKTPLWLALTQCLCCSFSSCSVLPVSAPLPPCRWLPFPLSHC